MRLILVRHGEPDYHQDCLLPQGHLQAEAAAERLLRLPLDRIYSSSCGRAYETALHTAEKRGMAVTQLDFMREIGWGTREAPYSKEYHPWLTADRWVKEGKNLLTFDATRTPEWAGTLLESSFQTVTGGFDAWFQSLGFVREGFGYRSTGEVCQNVVLFSHGGSSTCVLAHLTGIPVFYLFHAVKPSFTGITILEFDGTPGAFTVPIIRLLNEGNYLTENGSPEYNH